MANKRKLVPFWQGNSAYLLRPTLVVGAVNTAMNLSALVGKLLSPPRQVSRYG